MARRTLIRGKETIVLTAVPLLKPSPADLAAREVKYSIGVENPLEIAVRDLSDKDAQNLGLVSSRGVLVTEVKAGSAAAKNDLRTGDVITRINMTDIKNTGDFARVVRKLAAGKSVQLTLIRGKGVVRMSFNLP